MDTLGIRADCVQFRFRIKKSFLHGALFSIDKPNLIMKNQEFLKKMIKIKNTSYDGKIKKKACYVRLVEMKLKKKPRRYSLKQKQCVPKNAKPLILTNIL